jgi:hypothetical protein
MIYSPSLNTQPALFMMVRRESVPRARPEVFPLASGPAPLAQTLAIAAEALVNNVG